jgi:Transglycosylase SLT domain
MKLRQLSPYSPYRDAVQLARPSIDEGFKNEPTLQSLMPLSGESAILPHGALPPRIAPSEITPFDALLEEEEVALDESEIRSAAPLRTYNSMSASPVTDSRPPLATPEIVGVKRIPVSVRDVPTLYRERQREVELVASLIRSKTKEGPIPPDLAMAVAHVESSFNPTAVSKDGHFSKGIYQLLDSTALDRLKERFPPTQYEPFNAALNVELGVNHLTYLRSLFETSTPLSGDAVTTAAKDEASLERFMVAAFNAGEGRVALAQAKALDAGKDPSQYTDVANNLPSSTKLYVDQVFAARTLF